MACTTCGGGRSFSTPQTATPYSPQPQSAPPAPPPQPSAPGTCIKATPIVVVK